MYKKKTQQQPTNPYILYAGVSPTTHKSIFRMEKSLL